MVEEIDLEQGEATIPTEEPTVFSEIRRAYADAHGDRNQDFDHDQRCLSFLCSEWLEPTRAMKAVEFVGPYNYFEPGKVAERIETARLTLDHLRVAIGREGSPVLYFEASNHATIHDLFNGYADEFAEVEPPDIAGKERYRDEDSFVDEHSMCKHEEPPVEPGDEVQGDPESEHVYIRAWWD